LKSKFSTSIINEKDLHHNRLPCRAWSSILAYERGSGRHADLQLQIVGTGMPLEPEFGLTYHQIEDNGFKVDKNIEILLSWSTKFQ